MDYIKIGNEVLMIDLDAMTKLVAIELKDKDKCKEESTIVETFNEDGILMGSTKTTHTYTNERQVDSTRYELVRGMLDMVLTYESDIDESLGLARGLGKLPINIKIAINSLMNYGILTTKK